MLNFRKVHGAGNDFVLLAGTAPDLEKDWSETARGLCARRTGIGADGLVISAPICTGVLGVACFNADGSIATMCGNALRCAAWCAAKDFALTEMALVMSSVEHQSLVRDDASGPRPKSARSRVRPERRGQSAVRLGWACRCRQLSLIRLRIRHTPAAPAPPHRAARARPAPARSRRPSTPAHRPRSTGRSVPRPGPGPHGRRSRARARSRPLRWRLP